MKKDKPQGYFDEIERTVSKKDDLLQLLKGYDVSVHSNAEDGYEYLEDNDLMIVVKNPYCDKTLGIELAGEFSLFFDEWHTHYFAYEWDYNEMKKVIKKLLKSKIGVLVVNTSEGWLCSTLYKKHVDHLTDEIQLLKDNIQHKDTVDKFLRLGGCIRIVYWDPDDNISFDVMADDINPIRKFPRRSTVRFVVQNGEAVGSGSYKRVNDETAFLRYMWVSPSEEYNEKKVYDELYQILERDIVADGCKTVFVLCDEDACDYFHEKGFRVVKEYNQDILSSLVGVDVINNITMEKNIG